VDFHHRFPMGNQKTEFFDREFDVAEAFHAHVERGEPGHCVARSGLLAAVLLSAGCPARVVQLYPPKGKGHNVVEVWEEDHGWVIIDPTDLVYVQSSPLIKSTSPSSDISVQELVLRPIVAIEKDVLNRHRNYYFDPVSGVFQGSRVYPEPWLYLRVGQGEASWPFRGKFVVIEPGRWTLGPGQSLLRAGIIACVIAVCCSLAAMLLKARKKRPVTSAAATSLLGAADDAATEPQLQG